MVDGGTHDNDKMSEYVHELHEVDIGTGKSLADEIEYQRQQINKLQGYLNKMTKTLKNMNGIEYQLFYEIVVAGVPITKAVENIAYDNDIEPQTVWKNYYRKIKRFIHRIEETS